MSDITGYFLNLQENAVVMHAIVGWKSSIGKWSRVQVIQKIGEESSIQVISLELTHSFDLFPKIIS